MLTVYIKDGELALEERPTPKPGPHDVVITTHAAGLNAADLLQRSGLYPVPSGWPQDVPGLEIAGVVSAVGDEVREPLLGRRICAIVGGGGQSSHCVVPAEHLLQIPDQVTWPEAGGFAEAFTTAFDALVTQGQMRSGQRVLISGAAGGVGVAAVQLAAAWGTHVTAVTRTHEHHAELRALGANETVTLDDVADLAPVDVVLELIGAAHLELVQTVLNPFARVVVIGVGSGARSNINLLNFMQRRATITGSTLRARSRDEKATIAALMNAQVLPLWLDGTLRVPVARTFDLHDVGAAYDYFATPGKFGKVVLSLNQ